MEDIIIVGYGGHAKSVADCILRQGKYRIAGYTDTKQQQSKWKYLGTDDVLQSCYDGGIRNAVVGIGYLGKGYVREEIYEKLKKIGFTLPVICDPSAIVSQSSEVGEGTFIGKYAVINAETKIGNMVIINTKALVEHECVIADFSHVAVSATLCGQVTVGRGALVGANATVIQQRNIFPYHIVPAGAVIRK